MRPALEVADIFRRYGEDFRAAQGHRLTRGQRRVMAAIESCRTATLGGHVEACQDCGALRISYSSCRDRHCPKCQGLARAQWLADRQTELIPVPYFHVVFTAPAPIAAIALQNKAVVYDVLFKAAAETIRIIGADPEHLGGETGMIAILHTWGQTLMRHPHIHCLVPGGALAPEGRWISCRRRNFFLPVLVLSSLYRRLFLQHLQTAFDNQRLVLAGKLQCLAQPAAFATLLSALRKINWVVYAKPPFGGPQQVLDYLGRYVHRVAIANSRLLACDNGKVSFRWKDYRARGKPKVMTLDAEEFIRRFLLHELPKNFRRIRYYGFLASACRAAKLAAIRTALDAPQPAPSAKPADYRERYENLTGHRIDQCPFCGGTMIEIIRLRPTRPPHPTWRPRPAPASCDTS
jgi:hypothetical protein